MVLNVYLNDEGPSAKIQLLNTFKYKTPEHLAEHLLEQEGTMNVRYATLFSQMYRCQLYFVATSELVISWQHPNHPNFLVRSAYQYYVIFPVRIMLHHLVLSLPDNDGFSKVKNAYRKVHIRVSVMMVLIRMKYGQIVINFIQRLSGLHQKTLHDG